MSKLYKLIRNNWKKSTFGSLLVAYGVNYGINLYNIDALMTVCCEEAAKYGDLPVQYGDRHRRITVVLNPAANKRKAKKNFEKYCAPLLYLSGAFISIVETEKEGHARQIIDKIDPESDAIVVAGGDGTLSETLTGLMRQKGELCRIPIGVLPLGRTNTLANNLFGLGKSNDVNQMTKATMAIVKGNTKPIDALRIELIDNESEDQRPVYGVAGVEWGMWRDVRKQQDKLWYFGPLRDYASLLFPGPAMERNIKVKVRYTPPCPGCSQCYNQRPDLSDNNVPSKIVQKGRWWSRLTLQGRQAESQNNKPKTDYKKIINESCTLVEEKEIKCADIRLTTSVPDSQSSNVPKLLLAVGPKLKYQGQFITDGLKYIKDGNASVSDKVEVKQIEIRPIELNQSIKKEDSEEGPKKEDCLSIDSEDYEVRPIRVTILPNSVSVFCQ